MSDRKYAVQASEFAEKIWIGKINKAGTEFTQKEDGTTNILHAVAQFIENNFDSSAIIHVGGYRIDIDVAKSIGGPEPEQSKES